MNLQGISGYCQKVNDFNNPECQGFIPVLICALGNSEARHRLPIKYRYAIEQLECLFNMQVSCNPPGTITVNIQVFQLTHSQ